MKESKAEGIIEKHKEGKKKKMKKVPLTKKKSKVS